MRSEGLFIPGRPFKTFFFPTPCGCFKQTRPVPVPVKSSQSPALKQNRHFITAPVKARNNQLITLQNNLKYKHATSVTAIWSCDRLEQPQPEEGCEKRNWKYRITYVTPTVKIFVPMTPLLTPCLSPKHTTHRIPLHKNELDAAGLQNWFRK